MNTTDVIKVCKQILSLTLFEAGGVGFLKNDSVLVSLTIEPTVSIQRFAQLLFIGKCSETLRQGCNFNGLTPSQPKLHL